MTIILLGYGISMLCLVLASMANQCHVNSLKEIVDYQMQMITELQEFRGSVEFYMAGRIVVAEVPEAKPGMP